MFPLSRPRRELDYRLEMIDGEILLFHPGKTTIMYCNQSASLIWRLCDGQHTVQEITSLLGQAFPEAADTIPAEVEATLQQFHKHGAVEYIGEDDQTESSIFRTHAG